MSAGFAGRHVVSFLSFFIDNFLEAQDKTYSKIWYLIDYVVPGLHFWGKQNQGNEPKPNTNPGSLTSTQFSMHCIRAKETEGPDKARAKCGYAACTAQIDYQSASKLDDP